MHGGLDRYRKLFAAVEQERPAGVFLGGDLLPSPLLTSGEEFVRDVLEKGFMRLQRRLKDEYPAVFLILGNDDGKAIEPLVTEPSQVRLWRYAHGRRTNFGAYSVVGYAYVPPTPFLLKDWEKYDVGGYVPPGCVAPEDGRRSTAAESTPYAIAHDTIQADLEALVADEPLDRTVMLFHGPPYDTHLDRAALDGKMVDHVPLDVHVGSIAVRRFIEAKQPRITLHGHIHESARLTGSWRQRLGDTHAFGGAHDGPELALIRFDLEDPDQADRRLL